MGPQLDKTAGPNGVRSCTGICHRASKRIKIQFKGALIGLGSTGMAKLRPLSIVHSAQSASSGRTQAVKHAPDMAGLGLRPVTRLGLHTHNLAAAKGCELANVAASQPVHHHTGQQGQTATASSQHKGVIASYAPQVRG